MLGRLSRRFDIQCLLTGITFLLFSLITNRHREGLTLVRFGFETSLRFLSKLLGLSLFFICTVVATVSMICICHGHLLTHVRRRIDRRTRHLKQQVVEEPLAFLSKQHNYFDQAMDDQPQPFVFPETEAIEKEVQELISIILKKHIDVWFHHISQRPLFSRVVERLLRTALINLKQKLELVDVVGIIVRKAVPLLTQHLHEITIAEQHVMGTLKTAGIDALEQSSITETVAANAKGRTLHLAAQQAEYDEAHVLQPEDKLQSYLRAVVGKVLPILLPGQELESQVVKVFIREILTCAVLAPLFDMLADPDFWNETLVLRANQAIQERARVKRFRHVLKEQTQDSSMARKRSVRKSSVKLEKLMTSADAKDWDRLYRKIKKSQSLVDVTRMRNEIMVLQNEMLSANFSTEKSADYYKETRKRDLYVLKAMTVLESRIATLGGSDASTGEARPNLSFDRTLAMGTSYFFEFLERQGRVALLDFWQHLMQIKLRSSQPMPLSQLDVLDSSIHLSQDEIRTIVANYFDSPLLTITDEERHLIDNYLSNEPDIYDVDSNEVIVNVARRAYKAMVCNE